MRRPRSSRPPLRLPAEDGFTLIELLAAILLLTIGLLALVGGFDSARKLNLLSERRTSMAHRAQLEIERLEAIPYGQLAMISVPAGTTEYQYGENATERETLVKAKLERECTSLITTECGVAAWSPTGRQCTATLGACEWQDGPVSGNVYDRITWHEDPACKNHHAENYKRLTVEVTANVPTGNHKPATVRVSTLIANPTETKKEVEERC